MAFIIGTAGHIDHGKTSLIRSLTGVDLDTAPEEKERGITIALGFTSLTLEQSTVSFIDVPGHERLIRTMISGATGLNAVLLCVSATDSVMPQTIEHLNILNLLGIPQGIIAITMCDLADEEDIELITEELHELLEGTFLEGAPIIQTSAGIQTSSDTDETAPFGQQELQSEIQRLMDQQPTIEDTTPFRLPVDRVFSQKGFGTVVTGTARGCSINNGQTVQILPENLIAKIRSIQHHSTTVEEVVGGRVALNLSGIATADLSRGSVIIAPNSISPTQIVDLEYQHLSNASSLESGTRIRMLFGASEALGKVYRIDGSENIFEEGDTGFLQVRLDSPHILCRHDRCIIRRESPLETLGGGRVIDPYAPKVRQRNKEEQHQFLVRAINGDSISLLDRVQNQGRSIQEHTLLNINGGILLGKIYYGASVVKDMLNRLVSVVQQTHVTQPLKVGTTRMELSTDFPFLQKEGLHDLVSISMAAHQLKDKNGRLHHPSFSVHLSPQQRAEIDKLLQGLLNKQLVGLPMTELSTIPKSLMHYAFESAQIVRVANNIVHPILLNKLLDQLRQHFEVNQTLSTTEFKEMTQLSRKFSIPLLEWMDENQKTRRNGDVRISGGTLSEDV